MGCGESKHAVDTTEPIKKSTSRSNSRKIKNPVEDKTTKTITTTTTASSITTAKNGDSKAIDEENKKNGENPVGVIPGEPFIYQKPPMEATNAVRKGVVLKVEEKKLVVVVGHDRTVSKESQVSDYFSEDGVEEKSEYESPQPDEDRGSDEAVVVVQEYKKIENQGKTDEGNKQEEGVTRTEDDQVVVPKQDVQVEDGATMAAEDKGEQESADETVVVAVREAVEVKSTTAEAEITVERETKTIGTDEVKPTELEVRTIAEEKINDIDA